MNIEITDVMQKEIIRQVAHKLYENVKGQVNTKELAEDVKRMVASEVAGQVHKRLNTDNFVDAALKDAEERINKRITKVLADGVTLRLNYKAAS